MFVSSIMFDISCMLIVVYVCVLHSSIPYLIVQHIIHDHWSSFYFLSSWLKYRVLIVRHMIFDHHCLCLCIPELHTVSLLFGILSMIFLLYICVLEFNSVSWLFDISRMIIVLHVCVFQRHIPCPDVRHVVYDCRCSCLLHPEFHTESYCSTYHP